MNDFFKYYSKNNILTLKKYKEIDGFYKLSDDKLLDLYSVRFVSMFKRAISKSVFYKKLYSSHGISINSVKDLSDINKLPIIDKVTIRDHINELFIGFDFMKVIGLTSGTSGTPLTLYRTAFDIATEQAYIRHYREMFGYKLGQPLLSIRGTLGKSTPHHHFKKANILYISSPNINEQTIEAYYNLVTKFGPVAIEAYPSYLYKFCIELEKKGLTLQVDHCYTSSETLMDFQREKIEPFLNTTIQDWYGNAERTILLAQNHKMEYYPLPLYSINEFNEKDIVTTSLTNYHFPLIRYKVDDIIKLKSTGFENNLLHPQIESIYGRASDNLFLTDGSVVGCIDHAFKGVKHIEMAQVHQYEQTDPIDIKIIVNQKFSKSDEDQLRANFIRMVGTETPFSFTYAKKEDMVFPKNGKYQLVVKNRPQ
jgi:phenylacetate-CoA ligase